MINKALQGGMGEGANKFTAKSVRVAFERTNDGGTLISFHEGREKE